MRAGARMARVGPAHGGHAGLRKLHVQPDADRRVHTWGNGFQKYLADFKNWTKADFEAARRTDTTTLDLLTNRNASLVGTLEYDLRNYCGGKFSGSYSKFESSHAEQRGYLTAALAELPEALRNEAQAAMDALVPQFDARGEAIVPGVTHTIAGWQVRFGGGGEIAYPRRTGTSGCVTASWAACSMRSLTRRIRRWRFTVTTATLPTRAAGRKRTSQARPRNGRESVPHLLRVCAGAFDADG